MASKSPVQSRLIHPDQYLYQQRVFLFFQSLSTTIRIKPWICGQRSLCKRPGHKSLTARGGQQTATTTRQPLAHRTRHC